MLVDKAAWRRTVIRDTAPWPRCPFRNSDCFVTQFSSGHVHLRSYVKSFKLTEDGCSIDCGLSDTPEHAVLSCEK